jgi:hypothetical protein
VSHVTRVDRAQLPEAAVRPVFQDPTRRRWHGFLSFAGSGVATIAFLAVTLWVSVSATPDLAPMPDVIQPLPEAIAEVPAAPVELPKAPVAVTVPAVTAPAPKPKAVEVAVVEPREGPTRTSQALVVEPVAPAQPRINIQRASRAVQTPQVDSASIQSLDSASDSRWVAVPGASGGSIQELSR